MSSKAQTFFKIGPASLGLAWLALAAACGGDNAQGTEPIGGTPTAGSPTTAGSSAPKTSVAGQGASGTASAGRASIPATSIPVVTKPAGSAMTAAGSGGAAQAGAGGTSSAAGASAAGSAGAAGAAVLGGAGAAGADAGGAGCDHACLLAMMQMYIDGLLAHDASKLPVAANLKYTENDAKADLAGSVWKTAMKISDDTRLDFADTQEGQVASQFVFTETGGAQVIYQVRLKVAAKQITEIESMAARDGDQFFNPAGMKTPAVFKQKPTMPMSRDELRATTELYLDYLDGKKTGAELPFAQDCARTENGTVTAQGKSAFEAQNWAGLFDVTHRILVLDEEQGITWGMFPFDKSDTPLVVGEAFKIMDGEIKMIQAVMRRQPSTAW